MNAQLSGAKDRALPRSTIPRNVSAPSARGYRPDIDGLRAIAVVPVVLFHAGIHTFAGGYVGVDVFFVISGFLITGILVQSMEEGRYSIIDFYQRRARRIFPALVAMLALTLAVSHFILTPPEFKIIGNSTVSIAAFSSNFYFWKSVGYFDAAERFEPLLHTWSLAVEEQFYILFPILLYILRRHRETLVPILFGIMVLSLGGAELLLGSKPRISFYLMPARAWELIAGSILAFGALDRFWSRTAGILASWAGLWMIIIPVFFYTDATSFPGLAAVPPVLGACLLIWARGEGAGRLLSIKPVVWIGLLSYSLYLWHLPIFEFAKYLTGERLPPATGLALSLASVVVAWLSLQFIERPFRQSRTSSRFAVVAWAGLACSALAGLMIILTNGFPGRMSTRAMAILEVAQDKDRHHERCMSLDEKWVSPSSACLLGAPNTVPTVVLWGDSHAMITATSMEVAARRNKGAFLFAANADCPVGLGFSIDPTVSPGLTRQGHYRNCERYNREMLLLAEQPHIRSVVLSSRWSNWRIGEPANPAEKVADVRLRTSAGTSASAAGNRPIFERAFIMLIDRLRHAGKSVVIVGPVPEPSYDVPHRAYVSQFGLLDPPAPLTLAEYNHRHATILKFFKTLDGKVLFIWPSEQLCNRGQCLTQENGIPLYFDHNHLSFSSAQNLSHLYDSLFTLRSGMPSGQANAPQPWSGQNVRHASKHSDFLPERRD